MLEIQNCCKAFDGRSVLQDVCMSVPGGRIVGVFGASGIGKSTLAKLLCGVLRPDSGTILLDGQTLVSDAAPYDRRRGLQIQMVYQQPHASLDPSQKLGAGLRELIAYHHLAANRREADSQIRSILSEVQLPQELQNHLPYQISGGEAQKLALARALYKDAPVVVLDEPTAALDPIAENEIYSRFNSFVQSKTAIYISHRLSSCVFCDTIAVFDHARLVESGTHTALLAADGQYAALWNAQAKYYV